MVQPNQTEASNAFRELIDQQRNKYRALAPDCQTLVDQIFTDLSGAIDAISESVEGRTKRVERKTMGPQDLPERDILESISDGLLVINRNWQIAYINQRAAHNGYKEPEELIGKNLWDAFPQLLGTVWETNYRTAMVEQKPAQLEMKGVIRDSWYLIQIYPSRDGITVLWLDNTAHKRADEVNGQLLAENQRQKALLDAIFEADPSALAVLVGDDLHFAYINPAYRFIIPDPTQEPLGQPYDRVWPVKSRYNHRDYFRKVLKTGQPFQTNGIEHCFPDGTCRIFTVQARRIEWKSELAVLLIMWDTTELKKTEQALKESIRQQKSKTAELEAVLEAVPALVWIAHDRESRVITGNRYSSEFLRMQAGDNLSKTAPDEEIPHHFRVLKDGQEIPPDQLPVQWTAAKGLPIRDYNFEIQFDDGETRDLVGNASPLFDDNGQPCGAVSAFIDITQRKQAEQAVRESQARLADMLESTHDSFLAIDRNWRITYMNQHYTALIGQEAKTMIGKNFWEALPHYVGTIIEQSYRKAMEERVAVTFEAPGASTDLYWHINVYPTMEGIAVFALDRNEEKKNEEALKASEATLEAFFAHSPGILNIEDDQFRYLKTDPLTPTYFGLDRQSIVGKAVGDLAPVFIEQFEPMMRRVIETGQPELNREVMSPIPGRTGEMAYWQASYFPVPLPGGRTGIGIMGVEITERKRAEAQLRFQADLLENVHDAVIATDFDLIIIAWNKAAERLYGWTAEEALGKSSKELLGSEMPDEKRQAIIHQLEQTGFYEGESVHATKDRRRLILENHTVFHYDLNGHPDGFIASNRDITERKRAEEQLRESEEFNRRIIESSQDCIKVLDLDGNLLSMSSGGQRLLEIDDLDEYLQKSWVEFWQEPDRPRVRAAVQMARRGEVGRFQAYCPSAKGRPMWWDVIITPILGADGKPERLLSISRDVTQDRQAEQEAHSHTVQIELQHRLLEQREQERQQIARDLHDGPVQDLTRAALDVQSLIWDEPNPETAKKLEALRDCLQTQISDLRAYAGELRPPALDKFGLGKAIRSNLEAFQEKHPELKIQFDEDQAGELVPHAMRLALFRIYQESMTNIAKHAQATQVRVRLVKSEDQVLLEVVDNGVGFEVPEDWLRLAQNQHLGLIGIRERAETVGGQVEIYSGLGTGSQVIVKVPLTPFPNLGLSEK